MTERGGSAQRRRMTMQDTIPHTMTNAVTGEQHTIQLKPKGGMSAADAQAFLAGRVEEGKRIDPEYCAFFRMHVEAVDIYGIFKVPDEWSCVGKELFVRNLPDGDWVWGGDLPEEKAKAVYDRMRRERAAYDVLKTKFENAAATLKVRGEGFDGATCGLSTWDAGRIIDDAIAEFAVGKGVLDVATISHFVRYAIEVGIEAGRERTQQ
jgi:hypothetical protein